MPALRRNARKPSPSEAVRCTPDPSSLDVERLGDTLDQCLSRREVATALRTTGTCVHRWTHGGCLGKDGRMHVLPAIKVGNRYLTHKRDLAAFIKAINRPA
ncbi:helix-turn-helix domain-containing protein [Paludisphaera soli]|uniref:helix-turn-helix domain-containing protein n=1 Tax=Paludisphaera soli TaxID=2712865 RepID=UPI0013EDA609|nr:helix-turn-helix domain-containing protein [Paludisphaera soli]